MPAPHGEEQLTKGEITESDECAGHLRWRPLVLRNGERSAIGKGGTSRGRRGKEGNGGHSDTALLYTKHEDKRNWEGLVACRSKLPVLDAQFAPRPNSLATGHHSSSDRDNGITGM